MRRRLSLAAAGLVLALIALEVAVRVRQYRRYGTTVTSYYRFATDPETGLRIPEPGHSVGPISVNSRGFRGPEIEVPKPAGRLRIAFLGASTTFCAEASSFEATWPSLVVAGLRAAEPGLDLDFVNASSGGFTVEQSERNLESRVAPLAPDVIVYYEATNDLTVDTRRLAIEQGLYEAEESDHSAIGDWWLTWFLVEKNLHQFLHARSSTELLHFEPRELSRGFEQRLEHFVRAAQERCPVVALVTFSIQIRADQTPERQREAAASALYYMPFLDPPGLLAGYGEYNRVIRAVAQRTGAILIEGEETIPADSGHFADSVHFRDPGNRIQAQRVLEGLRAAPAFRALLEHAREGAGDSSGD